MKRDRTPAKLLLSVAAVCALLVGCATPKFELERVKCNTGNCDASVHVDPITCEVSGSDIDNWGSNNITWTIDQSSQARGFKFSDQAVHLGIFLKPPSPFGCQDAQGVFDSPQQTDKKFKLHNKGNQGTYCYGIYVVRDSPPSSCMYDPSIVNH